MDAWTVYLICMLDSFIKMVEGIGFVTFLVAAVLGFVSVANISEEENEENSEDSAEGNQRAKKFGIASFIALFMCFFFLLSAAFIPSTKQAIAIYTVPKITQNKQIENISEKSLDLVEEKLNSYLEDLKTRGAKNASR